MHLYSNTFSELLAQACTGNALARVRSCEDLERALVHIVRQTLREGIAGSQLARRILTEARRISPDFPFAPIRNQDEFVREIARGVCAEVVGRIQPRAVSDLAVAETVISTPN